MHDGRRVVQVSATGILLAIGVAYLVMGVHMNLVVVGPGLANRTGTRVGNDFSQFYAAAREVAAGRIRAVYSQDALRRANTEAIGADDQWTYAQWAYPPTLGLFLAPLARFRPLPAYWTWVVSTLLATALALYVVVRSVSLVALVFFFPGVVHAMICNQSALLNMALLAAGIASLRASPLAAGMCLGLLTYKPQAAMLLPVVLVAGRHGKAAAAWAATALGLIGASVLAFGPGVWGDFLSAARTNVAHLNAGSYRLDRMPTPYAALLLDGASQHVALVGQTAVTVLAALAAALVWRRSDRLSMQALALAAAVPLATPYAYDYDLAILVVPFVLLADERRRGEAVPRWALLALWLGPLAVPLAAHEAGWHLGPPILSSLVVLAGLDALVPRETLRGAVAAP